MTLLLVCRITHSRQNNHMFLNVNKEFLTMLMMSLVRDADALGSIKVEKLEKNHSQIKYSQISVIRTSIIRNYWVIRRRRTVPTFFSIIYCNKITDYSNFDYPKNSIFRSDSSVPMKKLLLKLPFKIRSQNVTHDDHDFFVWSSSIIHTRMI